MRKEMRIAALLAGIMAMATMVWAAASTQMTATVPFPFYVSDKVLLPAGEYRFVMPTSTNPTGSKVQIRKPDGSWTVMLLTIPGSSELIDAARLQFNCYEGSYFLSSVTVQGLQASLKPTKLENELKAKGQEAKSRVLIARQF